MLCSRRQPHTPRRSLSRRFTAWLLLLLCAWMGTGGVLHHTEAGGSVKRAHGAVSSLRHQSTVPADMCAACEWTQGLQGRTLSACRVPFVLLPLPTRVRISPISVLARTPRLRPSRAPPVPLAFC